MREFFFKVEGRHRSFWQPDYSRAFRLIGTIIAGTGTLTCENNNYVRDLLGKAAYKYIAIETFNDIYYREITGAVVNVDDELILTLDSTLPEDVSENNIKNISYLRKWRLDVDTVTMVYATDSVARCSLSMVTTKVE